MCDATALFSSSNACVDVHEDLTARYLSSEFCIASRDEHATASSAAFDTVAYYCERAHHAS
jgi:PleD family two-component response regulator